MEQLKWMILQQLLIFEYISHLWVQRRVLWSITKFSRPVCDSDSMLVSDFVSSTVMLLVKINVKNTGNLILKYIK